MSSLNVNSENLNPRSKRSSKLSMDIQIKKTNDHEDPSKYFENSPKNNFPRFDSKKKLIPYSFVGPEDLFTEPKFERQIFKTGTKIHSVSPVKRREKNEKLKKTTIVDNYQLDRLYLNTVSRIGLNNVNEFMNKVPLDIRITLKNQEKILNSNKILTEKNKKMIQKICSLSRKTEEESLINQASYFRKKNEVKAIAEQKFLKSNLILSRNQWSLDLRNYAKNKIKNTLIDDKAANELTDIITRTDDKFMLPKITAKMAKNRLFQSIDKFEVRNFFDLTFKGTKIIDEEIKTVRISKGKNIIHANNKENNSDQYNYECYSKLHTSNNM